MTQPVKWFASDMAGAPSSAGQVGQIIAILDACLVNGFNLLTLDSLVVASDVATCTKASHAYKVHQIVTIAGASPAGLNGEWRVTSVATNTFTFATTGISDQTATGTITAKASPAGWLKELTGTNKAVYSSQHASASLSSLRVDDSATTTASCTLYETMTDIDTGVNPVGPQLFKKSVTADATVRAWVLVADARGFYLGVAWSGTTVYDFYHFGDFDSLIAGDIYNCRLQCLAANPGTIGQYSGVSEGCCGGSGYLWASYTPRSYAAVYTAGTPLPQHSMVAGLSVNFTNNGLVSTSYNLSGNHGYYTNQNTEPFSAPNPGDGGLHFFPVFLVEGLPAGHKMLRGSVRGLLHVFESLPSIVGSYQILTGVESITGGLVLIIRSAGATQNELYPQTVLAFELGDWG